MATRRNRLGQYIRGAASRAKSAGRRVYRSVPGLRARTASAGSRLRSIGKRGPLHRPISEMVAPTLAVGAELTLLFQPLPDGDSWVHRLAEGYAIFKGSGNPFDLLGGDQYGNTAVTIAAQQLQANAVPAIIEGVEAAVLHKVGEWAGM